MVGGTGRRGVLSCAQLRRPSWRRVVTGVPTYGYDATTPSVRIGVEVNDRGHVVVDEFLRTANPAVWAVGDCIGGLQLAHLGAHVVGRQMVSNRSHPAADDSIADLISRLRQLRAQQP